MACHRLYPHAHFVLARTNIDTKHVVLVCQGVAHLRLNLDVDGVFEPISDVEILDANAPLRVEFVGDTFRMVAAAVHALAAS